VKSLKYKEIYLESYETVQEAETNIAAYFHSYNAERFHQSLNYMTPAEVY
jgi:putative transposase